jgi:catechol 2,3-dioxygenase-like lactoylglutathione lyase family enzyme
MNTILGLSHLTLAVSDLNRSMTFYCDLLGFSIRMRSPRSAYLEAGTLWLALVVDPQVRPGPLPEYSHAAFSVSASQLSLMAEALAGAGVTRWQEADRPDSFYFLDPDGHKLELHSGNHCDRLVARGGLRSSGVNICLL